MFSRFYLPALAWAVVIFILTLTPGKYMPPVNIWDIANFDKLAHLFVFAVLMVLALFGFTKQKQLKTLHFRIFLVAFLICASYGFLIEVMQGTILTDRYFELYDALANSIGCVAGGLLFKFWLQAIMVR